VSKWISVKDELPEEGLSVLVYDDYDDRFRVDHVRPYQEEKQRWHTAAGPGWGYVTHWMPLPDQPEEKK